MSLLFTIYDSREVPGFASYESGCRYWMIVEDGLVIGGA